METGSNEALFQSNRNLVRQESEAPTVVAETEGNQEGITLELLDVKFSCLRCLNKKSQIY